MVSDVISQVRELRVKELQWLPLYSTADVLAREQSVTFDLSLSLAALKADNLPTSACVSRKHKFPHWDGTRGFISCPDLQHVWVARMKLPNSRDSEVKVFLMNAERQHSVLTALLGVNLGFGRLL